MSAAGLRQHDGGHIWRDELNGIVHVRIVDIRFINIRFIDVGVRDLDRHIVGEQERRTVG